MLIKNTLVWPRNNFIEIFSGPHIFAAPCPSPDEGLLAVKSGDAVNCMGTTHIRAGFCTSLNGSAEGLPESPCSHWNVTFYDILFCECVLCAMVTNAICFVFFGTCQCRVVADSLQEKWDGCVRRVGKNRHKTFCLSWTFASFCNHTMHFCTSFFCVVRFVGYNAGPFCRPKWGTDHFGSLNSFSYF